METRGKLETMSIPTIGRAVLETLAISVPTLIQGALGQLTGEVCDRRLDRWSRRLLKQAGVTLVVRGGEGLEPGEALVVMSNHQSLYDIPALYQALGIRLRMVAKKELFRVPIWSTAMRAAGFIELDRGDHQRAVESLARARQALQEGTSIWIAPEGTRSIDGQLGPFKQGGFHLALETGARILPVSIDGTRQVLAAHGTKVHRGKTVRVTLGDPIEAAAYGEDRRKELADAVRQAIARHLPVSDAAEMRPRP